MFVADVYVTLHKILGEGRSRLVSTPVSRPPVRDLLISVNHDFCVALSERSLRAKSLGSSPGDFRRQKSAGSSE